MNRWKNLRKQNNQLDHQLNEENESLMRDMICYLRHGNIYDEQIEEIRQDLLCMILDAQEKHEHIKDRIGMNPQQFCNEIIANTVHKTFIEKVLENISIVFLCSAILLAIMIFTTKDTYHILSMILGGNEVAMRIRIPLSTIIIYGFIIFIAFLIVFYIMKNAFEKDTSSPHKIRQFCTGMLIMAMFIALIYVLHPYEIEPSLIVLCVVLLSLILLYAIINLCLHVFYLRKRHHIASPQSSRRE